VKDERFDPRDIRMCMQEAHCVSAWFEEEKKSKNIFAYTHVTTLAFLIKKLKDNCLTRGEAWEKERERESSKVSGLRFARFMQRSLNDLFMVQRLYQTPRR